ncbi:MAG TPA: hypothetical protein VF189_05360 [Patescibacteria group bacterium]
MGLENYITTAGTHGKKYYCDDLRRVGPKKPLSYLPLDFIKNFNGEDPQILQKEAQREGKIAIIFSPKDCVIVSGALYIADTKALSKLLNERREILEKSNWPTDPEGFIRRLSNDFVSAQNGTPLLDTITDAFGDYQNPNRSDGGITSDS